LALPWEQDMQAWSNPAGPEEEGRAKLLLYTRHQAALISVNAYDHMLTLARALGGDGAMPIFSHASLSRVVCEAAVRLAWLMDPAISSEERIVRGAAALLDSAEERHKGVRALPAEMFARSVLRGMVNSCTAERDDVQKLITDAGLTIGYTGTGKKKRKTSVELELPSVSAPIKINITRLMAELLPDEPSWYNVGSSVAHSCYWGLRDVDGSRPGESMSLPPNVVDIGAAVLPAISASGLILSRCGACYGHDASAELQASKERHARIDELTCRAATSRWAQIPVP
jgi:hypothetical protein